MSGIDGIRSGDVHRLDWIGRLSFCRFVFLRFMPICFPIHSLAPQRDTRNLLPLLVHLASISTTYITGISIAKWKKKRRF